MRKIIISSFIFGVLMLIVVACANMNASLKGGPKDVTPPKLAFSIPAYYAKNYKGKKVELTFDEFLKVVSEMSKELVISPPLKKRPTLMQRNKTITIILDDKDAFKENTTYTFHFGNTVQDLNEGNKLRNFEFVFSTGDTIDSLALRGKVLNSFNHTADKEGYYVMLYNHFEDSIPRKQLPNYVTKTDEKGYFTLTHLHADSFMIFALKDANNNLLFDLPSERIGFSDTLIRLNDQYFVPKDTFTIDTAKFDSLRNVIPSLKPQIEIFTFEEDHIKQYLSKYERTRPFKFNLMFNRVIYDSVGIRPMNFNARQWFLSDKKGTGDTLSYWITDTALIHKDTLRTIISYTKLDSIGKPFSFSDTIALTIKKIVGSKPSKKDVVKKKINEFNISSPANLQDGFDLNKKVYFTASFPLQSMDSTKIMFFKKGENKLTDLIPVKYSIHRDSVYIRKYWIHFNVEPNTEYSFIVDSAALTSIYKQSNDSTCIRFKTQKDDYYGTLTLNLNNVNMHTIIQIIGNNESVISEKYTDADGPVLFDFLPPGKYKIKVIYDRNKNNKWDTGNFAKRIQPERVDYFKDIITIRSNWDLNETWKLK